MTTITENSKIFAERMFTMMTPEPITEIINGVDTGINGLNTGITQLDDSIIELRSAMMVLARVLPVWNQPLLLMII